MIQVERIFIKRSASGVEEQMYPYVGRKLYHALIYRRTENMHPYAFSGILNAHPMSMNARPASFDGSEDVFGVRIFCDVPRGKYFLLFGLPKELSIHEMTVHLRVHDRVSEIRVASGYVSRIVVGAEVSFDTVSTWELHDTINSVWYEVPTGETHTIGGAPYAVAGIGDKAKLNDAEVNSLLEVNTYPIGHLDAWMLRR